MKECLKNLNRDRLIIRIANSYLKTDIRARILLMEVDVDPDDTVWLREKGSKNRLRIDDAVVRDCCNLPQNKRSSIYRPVTGSRNQVEAGEETMIERCTKEKCYMPPGMACKHCPFVELFYYHEIPREGLHVYPRWPHDTQKSIDKWAKQLDPVAGDGER